MLLALASGAAPAGAPAPGELRVGVARVPASLDPAAATTADELMALRLVYQGLLTFGERGDLEPALATAWSVSRDGLVWSFRLRPDVPLHDGTVLGTDDVVAALAERISAEGPTEATPPWLRPFRGPGRIVREVRRGAGGAVEVVLAHPYAPVLALLAHPALGVAVARDPGRRVGSGPYRVQELAPGRLTLEVAPTWRAQPPASSRITLQEMADDAAALAGLGPGGAVDVAVVRAPPGWAALGLRVVSATSWRVGLLAIRTDRGLTSRKPVRQAIALALDPSLVQAALGRWAVPHGGWLPPGTWAARDGTGLPFDPARARRLLLQLGGIDRTLTLLAGDQPAGPEAGGLAEAIRASLDAVGFRTQVRIEPPETALAAVRQGGAELALVESALEVNDPDFFLRPLLAADGAVPGSASNVAFLRSSLVDGMLLRAGQLGFRPERLRLYARLQTLLAEELPYVPVYARSQWLVARPEVSGMRVEPSGWHRLETMRIDSSGGASPASSLDPGPR